MNDTIRVLMNRKSIRVFENKQIEKEIKEIILQATLRAPSAGNAMMYSIIDVTDQKIKDALAKSCDNQPFIARASMILIFCADIHRLIEKYKQANCQNIPKPELSDLLLASNDAIIAAHTSCIAAQSLGIGSCYIGDIIENFEFHQELLNLPQHIAPICMLVFGYPTIQQKNRPQTSRLPMNMIVMENKYQELSSEQLNHYMTNEKAVAFFKRKYASDFSREMARSAKIIYKNWHQD